MHLSRRSSKLISENWIWRTRLNKKYLYITSEIGQYYSPFGVRVYIYHTLQMVILCKYWWKMTCMEWHENSCTTAYISFCLCQSIKFVSCKVMRYCWKIVFLWNMQRIFRVIKLWSFLFSTIAASSLWKKVTHQDLVESIYFS